MRWTAGVFAVIITAAVGGGLLYWQHVKSQPQYSLALIVKAAREDDRATLDRLIDSDAVVDDFVPQITAEAADMYGRGLPPHLTQQLAVAAEPLMPTLKTRVRQELPTAIRQRSERLAAIPSWVLAAGASRYLHIDQNGDTATIKSKLPSHSFEVKMNKIGDVWKITGFRDQILAQAVARRIGQELISAVTKGRVPAAIENLGGIDLQHLVNEANRLMKGEQ